MRNLIIAILVIIFIFFMNVMMKAPMGVVIQSVDYLNLDKIEDVKCITTKFPTFYKLRIYMDHQYMEIEYPSHEIRNMEFNKVLEYKNEAKNN